MHKATAVQVIPPSTLPVTFRDGTCRYIAMAGDLWGDVFEPLRDPRMFARATIDPAGGSVSWPTGADFSSEFLASGDEGPPAGYYDQPTEPDAATVDSER